MSQSAQFLSAENCPESVPFWHTWPLWVLDAAVQAELSRSAVSDLKVMPRTAEAGLFDGSVVKLRRKDAFPGRGANE